MYTPNNLYKEYLNRATHSEYSPELPDVTKKTTLDGINHAINLCTDWNSTIDVGCGNGHYLAGLSAKFKKAVGIELDTYPEHNLLKNTYSNIDFFTDTLENYNDTQHVDFVLLMDIFEHIPDLSVFLKKIASLQTVGGIVYITTPNPIFCSPANESAISARKIGYHGHIKHYTKTEIEQYMHAAGYQPEFHFYEETELRETLRRIVKGISRRHCAWSKHNMYRPFKPLVRILCKPLFGIISSINTYTERNNRSNMFDTRSIAIAFKKIA